MNKRVFQHDLAKAILHCTSGLEYDDAVILVRLVAPEIERIIAQKEQQKNSEKKTKSTDGAAELPQYIKVV